MLNSDDTLSGQANAVGAWKKTFSTVTPLSQISQRCFKYMCLCGTTRYYAGSATPIILGAVDPNAVAARAIGNTMGHPKELHACLV